MSRQEQDGPPRRPDGTPAHLLVVDVAKLPVDELRDLLQAVKAGDRQARRDLIALLANEEQFRQSLAAMARRALRGSHPARRLVDSQDVVQSALRTVMDQLSGFRGETEASFYGWLAAIIRTKVSRAGRTARRRSPG